LKARAEGQPWDDWLSPTDSMLVSAVCHPLYGRLEGQRMAAGGSTFEVAGYCFRHEPSLDPMRLQAFRQHDFVYVGDEQGARDFREQAFQKLLDLLKSLGLDAKGVAANDPFFGRAGRMLAHNQLSEELKLEIVVPIYPGLDDGTAIGSGNRHEDHFGAPFHIQSADGTVAHSACIGAGLERTTLALLRTYGFELKDWPSDVRAKLAL
jgi:seryl-tRNA synthetase